jgi:hypothetical protein
MNKVYRSSARGIALLMLSYCWPVLLQAQQFQQPQQEERELAPVSRTYAITNATVVQGPGRKMEQATVVVKDGLITAVGKNISIPPEAIVIKGDSLHIYAGFIDGLSRTGVIKPKEETNRERPKDPGNPTPEVAGINPQNDVRTALNPGDKSVEEMRLWDSPLHRWCLMAICFPDRRLLFSLMENRLMRWCSRENHLSFQSCRELKGFIQLLSLP